MPPRASTRVRVLVMQKRDACSSCLEETLLIQQRIYDNRSSEDKNILFCSLLDRCFLELKVRIFYK